MPDNFRDSEEFHAMWNFEGHISPSDDSEETAFGDRANAHTMDENPILYGFDHERKNRKGDK